MASASSITDFNEGQEITINGKANISNTESTDPLYSVDISWGDMNFTYTQNTTSVWDTEKLEFVPSEDNEPGSWIPDKIDANGLNSNQLKLENHSNADVYFTFDFEPESKYSNLKCSFADAENEAYTYDDGGYGALHAYPTATDNSYSSTVDLNLSGTPTDLGGSFTSIGKVTIHLYPSRP